MRHRKKTIKLNRSSSHRRALFSNLASSIIMEEKVTTTLVKAKAVQPLVDRLVTLGKKGTLAARRRALRLLSNQEAVKKLFSEIAPRFEERAGGYTRVLKLAAPRTGDGSILALITYVETSDEKKAPPPRKKKTPPPDQKK